MNRKLKVQKYAADPTRSWYLNIEEIPSLRWKINGCVRRLFKLANLAFFLVQIYKKCSREGGGGEKWINLPNLSAML
jgi:hypothetical protein